MSGRLGFTAEPSEILDFWQESLSYKCRVKTVETEEVNCCSQSLATERDNEKYELL